ncbi:SDR family NAD(P)-dependent oxidoreductase [Spirillospora sp. NPDC048911]|uniref:SDR family NAD(P)-dependent oxidoreductase n=1 Tax=Spirillospora sp. NPDC048911 TaxID=3364527 RepID=UPI00371BE2EB
MSTSLLLQDKTAVIYGAGGAIGHAVARTFAREGTRLFLTGRTLSKAEVPAKEIVADGGVPEAAQANALDENAVAEHLDTVIEKAGGVDISFNAVGLRNTTLQGVPLVDLGVEEFMRPVTEHVRARKSVLDTSTVCRARGRGSGRPRPPLAELDPADPRFLQPAHGVNGCPICRRKCTQSKSDRAHVPAPRTSRDW